MGDFLPPIDLANRAVRQVSAGSDFTCAALEDDKVYCWGDNLLDRLGTAGGAVGTSQGEMGQALVAVDLFVISPGEALEGLRIVGTETSGFLQIQYNGSWGLICDDQWNDANAQVACRQLGLAGGRAFSAAQNEAVQACIRHTTQANVTPSTCV